MKRILIEIDERFVTRWGYIYFGIKPTPEGLEFNLPHEPACLPGFEYVNHPDPAGVTFRISDLDVLEKMTAPAALSLHKGEPQGAES